MVLGAIYHYCMNAKGLSLVEIVASIVVLSVIALGATATVTVVNSDQVRMAGGSTLELQALSFARQTIEELRNDVRGTTEEMWYANNSTAWSLADNSYAIPCTSALGQPCGVGTWYTPQGAGFVNGLPPGNLATRGGRRRYLVQDMSTGVGTAGMDVAYKRIIVQVDQWAD